MTYSQWESKILCSGKLREDFLFYFYFTERLTLAIYKQCAYILALEYTDQVGNKKMKELEIFL